VKVIEIATGNELHSFMLGAGSIPSVEFDARGKHIVASGPGGAFQAIKISTGEVTVIDPGIGWVAEYRFSPDGRYMAAGSASGIIIWDARTWKELRRIGGDALVGGRGHVAFSRDSKYVAAINAEGQLCFWDPGSGLQAHIIGQGLKADGPVEFTADGRVLAAGADGNVHVFGPGSGAAAKPSEPATPPKAPPKPPAGGRK
jgi:WD40 repeat protein